MPHLQTHSQFKLDFQKVDEPGKLLINGTKHYKDNQFQGCKAWHSPVRSLLFKKNVQGQKYPGRCVVAEPEQPSHRKLNCVIQNEKTLAIRST